MDIKHFANEKQQFHMIRIENNINVESKPSSFAVTSNRCKNSIDDANLIR